jgi:hypothetical protein
LNRDAAIKRKLPMVLELLTVHIYEQRERSPYDRRGKDGEVRIAALFYH